MNVIEKGDHYPLTSTPVDYVDLEGSELDFDWLFRVLSPSSSDSDSYSNPNCSKAEADLSHRLPVSFIFRIRWALTLF